VQVAAINAAFAPGIPVAAKPTMRTVQLPRMRAGYEHHDPSCFFPGLPVADFRHVPDALGSGYFGRLRTVCLLESAEHYNTRNDLIKRYSGQQQGGLTSVHLIGKVPHPISRCGDRETQDRNRRISGNAPRTSTAIEPMISKAFVRLVKRRRKAKHILWNQMLKPHAWPQLWTRARTAR
jgi:hypothetical protein